MSMRFAFLRNTVTGPAHRTQEPEFIAGENAAELLAPLVILIVTCGLLMASLAAYIAAASTATMFTETGHDQSVLQSFWCAVMGSLSCIVLLRWCAVHALAYIAHRNLYLSESELGAPHPFVSILVPAYQEEETIEPALKSLVELDYPHFEIIVIDDGSTDHTFENAVQFVGNHRRCRVRLFRKPNGGKWSALNYAFAHAAADLILCIDADSLLSKDALKRLVAHMHNPNIAAVSGQVTVRNRTNMITRLQAFEYLVANGGARMAQSLFGLVLLVPGPIGLYRRSALEATFEQFWQADRTLCPGEVPGPLSPDTFAEDFQLSLMILALGGKIIYEPRALSYTKSPDLTMSLLNQRYRWFRGTMQVLKVYRTRLRDVPSPTNKPLRLMVSLVYLLDLWVLPPLQIILIGGLVVSVAVSYSVEYIFLLVILGWFLRFISGMYHILAQGDNVSLLQIVPFYDLYNGLLLNAAWAIACADEFRQAKMNW